MTSKENRERSIRGYSEIYYVYSEGVVVDNKIFTPLKISRPCCLILLVRTG